MDYFNSKVEAKSVLSIGKPLVLDVSDPELAGMYKSSIFDVDLNERILTIGMPSFRGQYVPLPAGTRAYVKMIDQSSMYVFNARVISYEKNAEGFYVSYISFPQQLRKIQRRVFVRVPFFKKGTFMYKDSGDEEKEVFNFITKDLSAGGLLIVTRPRIEVGVKLLINLDLTKGIELKDQDATVVRVDTSADSRNNIYGIQFNALARSKEDKLVRFVFHLEQERRKKDKNIKGEG